MTKSGPAFFTQADRLRVQAKRRDVSVDLDSYSKRKLLQALRLWSGLTVTGYILNARIVARSAFGGVFCHERADRFGRFANGHRIITSDVISAEPCHGFWALQTKSGSLYVVVTFDANGGRESLDTFFSLNLGARISHRLSCINNLGSDKVACCAGAWKAVCIYSVSTRLS